MSGQPFPVDPYLTGIVLAHKNPEFVADRVLPFATAPIDKQLFKWMSFDFSELITVDGDGRVGRKSIPNEAEFGMTEQAGMTSDYGEDAIIPNDDITQAPAGFDPKAHAALGLQQHLDLLREKRVAGKVFDPTSFPSTNKTALSGSSMWSDPLSDPAKAISDAADVMIERPNCMVIGRDGWSTLRRHPRLVASVKSSGTDKGALTLAEAQEAVDIPEIIIGDSWKNDQRRGQAPVRTRVWGNSALLFYRAPSIAPTGTTMTFGWTQSYLGRVAGEIPEPKIGLRGSVRVRVGQSLAELISAPEAGYLFSNIR